MSNAASSQLAIIVASFAALLYSRAGVLSLMYTNAPSRLQKINNLKSIDVRFTDILRYCEDAVLDTDAGFALLSCDAGRGEWNTVMACALCNLDISSLTTSAGPVE